MDLTILDADQVRAMLPMAQCIELMARALADLAGHRASQPLRTMMPLPDQQGEQKGILGVMPAESRGAVHAHGLKAVNILPGNRGTRHDAHQGAVLLFEPEFGRPAALIEGSSLTAIRTAAVSAVATRVLATPGAATLGVLGAGVQARSHIEALHLVREIREVHIWNRTPAAAEALARETRERFGTPATVADTAEAAARSSTIVCAVTGAPTPILRGAWLTAGTHVNLVGSSSPDRREADGSTMAQPRIFTDSVESLRAEAGEYVLGREEGALPADQELVELGAILEGHTAGRTADQERTVFKALGLAVEDITSGWHVLEAARAHGVGTSVSFGAS